MRVLLVEDDREVAEYVRRELEEEFFEVKVAYDGATGSRHSSGFSNRPRVSSPEID